MKKNYIRIFLGAVLSVAAMQASAQKTAFTFSFFNMAYYANTSPITQGYMGIGLERNVGDYISLKLEINKGFQILYNISDGKIVGALGSSEHTQSYYDSTLGYSTDFAYHWTVPCFDINYQSKFFFRGNDKTGPYMSMGIGIRSVKYIFHTGAVTDLYDSEDVPHDLEKKDGYYEKLTVIPLILRVGARGDMDGFFPDFSFGIGYNFSHDKTVEDKTITKTWDLSVPKLSALTIVAGISFGIGW